MMCNMLKCLARCLYEAQLTYCTVAAMRSLDRIGQSARPEVLEEVMNADKTQNYIKSMYSSMCRHH